AGTRAQSQQNTHIQNVAKQERETWRAASAGSLGIPCASRTPESPRFAGPRSSLRVRETRRRTRPHERKKAVSSSECRESRPGEGARARGEREKCELNSGGFATFAQLTQNGNVLGGGLAANPVQQRHAGRARQRGIAEHLKWAIGKTHTHTR